MLTYQTEVLLYETHPQLAKHFHKFEFDLSVYSVKWFFSVFCIDLPEEFVFQILDFYQYEQSAVFVRVALTMLILLAPRLLETTCIEQLHEILRRPYIFLRQYSQQTFFRVTYQKITL